MVEKKDIRTLSLPEIEHFFFEKNEKKFRAHQVYDWLWKKYCLSFREMTNLSVKTRELLDEHFTFSILQEDEEIHSSDGTIKSTFRLPDEFLVESALIPSGGRTTACISSQSGCPLACRFCATGKLGFQRDLKFTEIVDQVVFLSRQSEKYHGRSLSNIVYMGMGEPLLNYDEVMRSVQKITDENALGMSPQRITISSVGIPEMIRKMADDKIKVHFALSLHAATDSKRNQIIPVNKKYSLKELSGALKYYHLRSGKRFTIEYILFRNFNDTLEDAHDLSVFCKSFPVKINLLDFNPVEGSEFEPAEPHKMNEFKEYLLTRNLVVNVRKSRGKDINAACGQLALWKTPGAMKIE